MTSLVMWNQRVLSNKKQSPRCCFARIVAGFAAHVLIFEKGQVAE